MKTTYYIDIDGTIAQYQDRLRSAGPEPSREPFSTYQAWLDKIQTKEALLRDKAVPGMLNLVRALKIHCDLTTTDKIVYLTAREENLREVTDKWLNNRNFPVAELIMRPTKDLRENHVFKQEVIERHGSDVVVMIDDDPSNKLQEVCRLKGWIFLKAVTY